MTLDKDRIRARLESRRRQLLARYQGAIDRVNEELDTREIEDVENAQEQWDARVLTAMSNEDARALEQVVGALVRLDEGEYGICVDCGEEIDPKRLEAIPEAARCVADEEKREAPRAIIPVR